MVDGKALVPCELDIWADVQVANSIAIGHIKARVDADKRRYPMKDYRDDHSKYGEAKDLIPKQQIMNDLHQSMTDYSATTGKQSIPP
jgi:hypothetical protein